MNLLLPAILVGYLVGSIPFGLIFTRIAGYGDVRTIGSGNIGATNVLRTGDKTLAAATLVFDALKGTAAVILGPLAASLFLDADTGRSGIDTAIALAPAAYTAGVAAFFVITCYAGVIGLPGNEVFGTAAWAQTGVQPPLDEPSPQAGQVPGGRTSTRYPSMNPAASKASAHHAAPSMSADRTGSGVPGST